MMNYMHERLLNMFREVVKIFEQNEINYMVCGGTLLGAVTRKGFIPWDDDVDICVFEKDYARAQSLLTKYLPDDMILQCDETEPKYYHGWVKVRDKNSKVYPFESRYNYNGVWIDIYCLVPSTVNRVSYDIVKEHIRYLFRRYASDILGLPKFLKEFFARNLMLKFLVSIKDSYTVDDHSEVCIIRSASHVVVQKDLCVSKNKYQFEDITVASFANADEYLKKHYGDEYMNTPPPSQRRISIERIEIRKD